MGVAMRRKVMIVPAGLYEERVYKGILRSQAQQIYLLKGTGFYEEKTSQICDRLKSRITGYLKISPANIMNNLSVNFSNIKEVIQAYSKIIEEELAQNPTTEIIIDVTSTTKEGILATCLLAMIYDVNISYVPPHKKSMQKMVEKRWEVLEEFKDEGSEPFSLKLRRGTGLNEEKKTAIKKIYGKGRYNSISDFVKDMKKNRMNNKKSDRYWIRLLHELEDKGLITILESEKKTKTVLGTDLGEGIFRGLFQSKGK